MRGVFRSVLVALVLAGCVPREELRGTGGSGGFHTIQVRILALIAARNYAQAYEYLELAADLTQEQHDRFKQMISAAERGLTPFLDGAVEHIFRESPGHFAEDTAEARELIQTTVTEDNFVGIKAEVVRVYQRILETGGQIWVQVTDGTIRDAGRNLVPRSTEELLKGRK